MALLYGKGLLDVVPPASADVTVIRKPALPTLSDPADAVRTAFDEPVGCASLSTLAAGRASACIVICDITRPVPNHLFLRPMVETLVRAGIPLEAVTILVANGLHREGDAAEIAEVIGDPWVVDHVRVEGHRARDRASLVDLGVTATRGTPILLNRRLVEADLRIVTGLVEPHFMAGWSGGRKVVAPGVAGEETIRTFHSARFMEDPLATQCTLTGNPLHEEQLEIVGRVGELYALNTVIDEDRRLSFVNFGEIVESHLEAVGFVSRYAAVEVPRRFHTVVTSAAGYPLDKTYYQTVKGMVTPVDILAPGGTLIIASECSEGIGSAHFRASQERLVDLGADGFLTSVSAKRLADIDEWQTEMQLKPMRVGQVQLYTTGLNAEDLRITGVEPVGSVDEAIAASIARHGDPAVAIIPEGPYVVPRYAATAPPTRGSGAA
ncbi:MAG TPA: nickel-dependent lactate racemase [Propionibacteriaceae bacterium]|nr:nickel-dependent lactate racemase [Propionibacteriaceae bacterium]